MVMKTQNKLANRHPRALKILLRRDQRTPWFFLGAVAVFVATCRLAQVDPQDPLPATLITFASLLAVLKM